jgi:hypothetical protein
MSEMARVLHGDGAVASGDLHIIDTRGDELVHIDDPLGELGRL